MASSLQGTADWFAERVGCLTASHAEAIMKRGARGQKLQAYSDELSRVIAERITGEPIGIGVTEAMQWGIDHEDEAREAYEALTGQIVEEAGFIPHPFIKWLGASPDGLIGDEGMIEIKCPNTLTHIERVLDGQVPEKYKPQMLVQLLCTGRKFVDFIDYDPRMIDEYEHLRIFVVRFEPTKEERDEAEAKCKEFLAEVEKRLEILRNINQKETTK